MNRCTINTIIKVTEVHDLHTSKHYWLIHTFSTYVYYDQQLTMNERLTTDLLLRFTSANAVVMGRELIDQAMSRCYCNKHVQYTIMTLHDGRTPLTNTHTRNYLRDTESQFTISK